MYVHVWATWLLSGLRKSSVWSSGISRFSFWACTFSFSLAQWARDQASHLPTKSLRYLPLLPYHCIYITCTYLSYSEDEHITSLAEFKVQKISPRHHVSWQQIVIIQIRIEYPSPVSLIYVYQPTCRRKDLLTAVKNEPVVRITFN